MSRLPQSLAIQLYDSPASSQDAAGAGHLDHNPVSVTRRGCSGLMGSSWRDGRANTTSVLTGADPTPWTGGASMPHGALRCGSSLSAGITGRLALRLVLARHLEACSFRVRGKATNRGCHCRSPVVAPTVHKPTTRLGLCPVPGQQNVAPRSRCNASAIDRVSALTFRAAGNAAMSSSPAALAVTHARYLPATTPGISQQLINAGC